MLRDSEEVDDYELEGEYDPDLPEPYFPEGILLESSEMHVRGDDVAVQGELANESGEEERFVGVFVNRLGVTRFERALLSRHPGRPAVFRTTPRLSRGLPFYASVEAGACTPRSRSASRDLLTGAQRPSPRDLRSLAIQAHIYGCASVACILPATEIL